MSAARFDVGAPLRVGVVGVGALGRHHVRLLAGLEGATLAGVYDLRADVAEQVAAEFGTRALPSLDALAAEADAMVVAVPTTDHAEVGCRLLERGLHVMVEKPIAPDLASADRLLASAAGAAGANGCSRSATSSSTIPPSSRWWRQGRRRGTSRCRGSRSSACAASTST